MLIPRTRVHLPTVLMALILDAVLIVFVLTTVHSIHGWLGVAIVMFASVFSNYLYHHAKRPQPRQRP